MVNKLIVSAFCSINKVKVTNNILLIDLLINYDNKERDILNKFIIEIKKSYKIFDFEAVINLFEFVISPKEKEINGAIYTPKNIRDYIISETILKNNSNDIKVCDIACGCGGFLIDSAKVLNDRGKSFYSIYNENIYGVDIASYSIERTKILLSLIAVYRGEDIENFNFNLFTGNSLEFDWFKKSKDIKESNGFDYILGNPPYVSSENIDSKSKELASNWSTSNIGKLDLYIPFFEIAISWLKEDGILGYITVNSFYRSLNGRKLRNFFSENQFNFKLIDFGNEQIFKNRITYTCICIIQKNKGGIKYTNTKSSNLNQLTNNTYIEIDYKSLNNYEGWLLNDYSTTLNIKKLENTGIKLDEFVNIKNGFATLRNKIYLINPSSENENFFLFSKNGKKFKVEKSICRKAIKPNVLKNEDEISDKIEYIIFPYQIIKGRLTAIEENYFKEEYPEAYKYLKFFKFELAKRDNGNKKYEKWYAFGRNQALTIKGKKLLFPYLSNKPYFVYTDRENLLFYNGYAIIDEDKEKLSLIKIILNSDIFWNYVKIKSKPYSSGYYSFAKNYIKYFTIPELNNIEKKKLLSYKRKSSVNKFLIKKYDLIDFL